MPKVDYKKVIEENKENIIEAFVAVYGETKRKHIEKVIGNMHLFFVRPLDIPAEEYEISENLTKYANQFLANMLGVGAYELEEYAKSFVENYPTVKKIADQIKCVYDKISNKENVQENMQRFTNLTNEKQKEKEKIENIYRLDVMRSVLIEQFFDGYALELFSQEDILHDKIHLFHFLGATVNENYNENVKGYDLYNMYFTYLQDEKIKTFVSVINTYITKAQEEKQKIYDYVIQNVKGAKEIEEFANANQVVFGDLTPYLLFGMEGVNCPCYVAKKDKIEPFVFLNREKLKDIILIHELTHAVETMLIKKEHSYAVLKIGAMPYLCDTEYSSSSYKEQCDLPYFDIEQEKKIFDIAEKENASVFSVDQEYNLNEVITQYLAEKVTDHLHSKIGKLIQAKRVDTYTTNLVDVLRPVLDSLQDKIVSARIGKDWKAMQKALGVELYEGLRNFCNHMIFDLYASVLAFQSETPEEKHGYLLETILPTLLEYEEEWDTRYKSEESQYFIEQAKPLLDYMKTKEYRAYVDSKKRTTDEE